ncbi:hypothetical protein [Paenibacillus pasadenensis]|uniref:hypothetical protein n=1 Tax=Paenibacillus pasadenensis TaxID=217090 RepID=UPI00203C2D78|nr:hypothetical protein [Paenibacillus pasadenensis]
MAIRKADLRAFIEKKARKRKAEMNQKVLEAMKAAFKPVIHEVYKDLDPIERNAASLHDALLEVKERHRIFRNDWPFSRTITEVGNLTAMRQDIINEQAGWACHNLLSLSTNRLHDGLETAYHEVEKSMAAVVKEYRELAKVTDEVLAVVDGSRNGDKAYQKLDELGVDLSGFTPPNPNLPALIKLSADVCVLNGNCSEAGKP